MTLRVVVLMVDVLKEKKEKKIKLVDKYRDGCTCVETFMKSNGKVFYVLHVDYREDGAWIHQKLSVLDSEIQNLMCLLRKACLMPKMAYNQISYVKKLD